MDKIIIKELEIYAYHGVNSQEKDMGQKFYISLELSVETRIAAKNDDLLKTVNYAEVCYAVEEEFKRHKLDLIETAAENIAEFILQNYHLVKAVKLTLKKPWAPIGKPLDYVAVDIERSWHTAYIAFGANLGNKEENITSAIELLNKSSKIDVLKVSSLYETTPVGEVIQDDFLNGVLKIKTLLEPKELLDYINLIEAELKRERIVKWGPRTIDLDILLYDDLVTSDEILVIPHPLMQERAFVLKPLAEIAPFEVHPLYNKRILELLDNLK